MMKTGLVIEGGGVRALFAAGVLDAILDDNIKFDGVIGVSAGAVHGSSFVSKQKGRTLSIYKTFSKDSRFMGLGNFLRTGDMCDADFCYHTVQEELVPFDHRAFETSDSEFYVVCTNVETGAAEYIRITDMKAQIDYLRASASVPFLSRPVSCGDKLFLDGGCGDSIPFAAFKKLGFARCVVVLTREAGYAKKPMSKFLINAVYRKYPAFAASLRRRHEVYNAAIDELADAEAAGTAFVIRPPAALAIGRWTREPKLMQQAYDIGLKSADACLHRLKLFLHGE